MKKLLSLIGVFALIALLSPVVTGLLVADEELLECPSSLEAVYYYSPDCSHCRSMKPLIQELDSKCSLTKINVEEQYDLAIANQVYNIPTLVIGEERLVGEFTVSEVNNLIRKHL